MCKHIFGRNIYVHFKFSCACSSQGLCVHTPAQLRAAVLNLWAAAHWCAADLCLVGRDQGWELRNFLCESLVDWKWELECFFLSLTLKNARKLRKLAKFCLVVREPRNNLREND